MTITTVFFNGRSQAIRLPKAFRVGSKQVFIKKTPEGILITERDPWEVFAEGCNELSDNFMKARKQPPLEKRLWHA